MENSAMDEMALCMLLQKMKAHWDQGDAVGYAEQFTLDSDYITFMGTHLKGRHQNADEHRPLFDNLMWGSTMIWTDIESIVFLSPDVALLHTKGYVRRRWQRKVPNTRRSIQILVAVKQDGEWKIRAFHNTRIEQPGFLQKWMIKVFFNRGSRQ